MLAVQTRPASAEGAAAPMATKVPAVTATATVRAPRAFLIRIRFLSDGGWRALLREGRPPAPPPVHCRPLPARRRAARSPAPAAETPGPPPVGAPRAPPAPYHRAARSGTARPCGAGPGTRNGPAPARGVCSPAAVRAPPPCRGRRAARQAA